MARNDRRLNVGQRWSRGLNSSAAIVFATCVWFALATNVATAQPTFSIDGQSPSSFGGAGFGGAFSEGDLLGPGPFLAAGGPGAFGLGFVPTGTGPAAPVGTYAELDAVSYGTDAVTPFNPLGLDLVDPFDGIELVHQWNFSVDEFAGGDPFGPPVPGPSVFTEGATGMGEASADVFVSHTAAAFGGGIFPPPPFSFFPNANTQVLDGDGVATPNPGLGLVEPNPPAPAPPFPAIPDVGDNLDAVDVDAPFPGFGTPVFFSLDGGFADPIENPTVAFPGPNFGTAAANAVSGADILTAGVGTGAFGIYAPSFALDLTAGDDIDALAVADVGPTVGISDPVTVPGAAYDWLGGGSDMVLFSLRRGSPTIGTPDAFTGTPIEEGDILTPTATGAPGIFVAAEDIGLGTLRSGTATFVDSFATLWADDLDALDVVQTKLADVTGDYIVDDTDIDAMAALPGGPVAFGGGPLEADIDRDFFVDPTFNPGTGTLVSDTDWIIRGVLGTEYGDANLDGMVNFDDFLALQGSFGAMGGWATGDFNGDMMVNFDDFLVLQGNFGFAPVPLSATELQSVPEPGTLFASFVALLSAAFILRRRVN